jgi:hypothetical protein
MTGRDARYGKASRWLHITPFEDLGLMHEVGGGLAKEALVTLSC